MAGVMAVGLMACTTQQSAPAGDSSSGGSDSSAEEPEADAKADDASKESDDTGGSKGTIVFSTKTITNNEFQRVMAEEAQKVVEAAGYNF